MDQAEIEVLIGELETRLDRLRALYDQYFVGIEKLEPSVPRKDVERRFYVLRREQIRNTGLRFRFNMLVQRFSTFTTYWQRTARQIENGTFKRDVLRAKKRFGQVDPAVERDAKRALDKEKERELARSIDVDVNAFKSEPPPSSSVSSGPISPAPSTAKSPSSRGKQSLTFDEDLDDPFGAALSQPPPPPRASIAPPARQMVMTRGAGPSPTKMPPPLPGKAPPLPPRKPGMPPPPPLPNAATRPAAPPPNTSAPAPRETTNANISVAALRGGDAAMTPNPKRIILQRRAPAPGTQDMSAPRAPSSNTNLPPPAPSRPAASAIENSAPRRRPSSRPPKPPDPSAIAAARPVPKPAPSSPQTSRSGEALSDERVRQIYTQYVDAKRSRQESTASITYDNLAKSLRESSAKLKEKHTGKNVDFEVAEKDGKTILRPIVK